RGRKWPRLRGEIVDAPAHDAGLLAGFAPHRVFDRLARFDEAREAGPHAGLKAVGAAEHAALTLDREHDCNRIGAREMLRVAGRTIAPPAAFNDVSRRPTIR